MRVRACARARAAVRALMAAARFVRHSRARARAVVCVLWGVCFGVCALVCALVCVCVCVCACVRGRRQVSLAVLAIGEGALAPSTPAKLLPRLKQLLDKARYIYLSIHLSYIYIYNLICIYI